MSITFSIHVEKYVESMLNIYFPFAKALSHINALLFFVLYAWGLPQVLYSYITAMSKYSNDMLEMYPSTTFPRQCQNILISIWSFYLIRFSLSPREVGSD